MLKQTGTTLVVVSHYNARPVDCLVSLLDSMRSVPSGWPFRVRVVLNQEIRKPLVLPTEYEHLEIVYRKNIGYNIGAWDAGWRVQPRYDAYCFLQEECRVIRDNWIRDFVVKASDPKVGLVGECLSRDWDAPWEVLAERTKRDEFPEHLVDGHPCSRLGCYFHFFASRGIPPGAKGDHLQALILFARRHVLEAINGFPVGKNYGEAVAAEIAISKKVQALGFTITEVGPEPFFLIEHPQWLHRRYEASNQS